ncbi:preprotein translocase subunit SecY, partial [Salmonella enterica subsp. enterica serovar Enteritidis]
VPSLEAMKKDGGEAGRKKLNQYTRYGTLILATVQAYGMAVGLEKMAAAGGMTAVINPGMFFRMSTIITVVGGTMFLVWLGEQITSRGVGQGTS